MFENLVKQDAGNSISSDIKKHIFPGAVLFSGSVASGKLTAALETARVLSCYGQNRGSWQCDCPSCLQHKALTCTNLLLLGPRDCFLEIQAAKKTFLESYKQNATYLTASRYLFLRSIRKLTLRFNGILWQGENNLNKIAALMDEINVLLESLDFPRSLPPYEETEKLCEELAEKSLKLENEYLYDSIPVNQIRNMEAWAHIKSEEGKKTVIIENADRMQNSVRNALLKILEEPPEDCVFILLTSKRNAMMETILSRVRTYNFKERTLEEQSGVITRVFHNDAFSKSISDYLLTFLPVSPDEIKAQSDLFYNSICLRSIPDISSIVKKCGNFNPRVELQLFIKNLIEHQKKLLGSAAGCETSAKCMELLRNFYDSIIMYNQSPAAALECLLRDMSALNVKNGGIFC